MHVESGEVELLELRKEVETERLLREQLSEELDKEIERSDNLQGVLEDFQSGLLLDIATRVTLLNKS